MSKSYRRHPTVAHTEVSGEVFVVTADNRMHHLAQPTSRELWNKLGAGPATVDDLTAWLCERFEAEPSTVSADVQEFLDKGVAVNILVAESL
jgi:hypothetical protein